MTDATEHSVAECDHKLLRRNGRPHRTTIPFRGVAPPPIIHYFRCADCGQQVVIQEVPEHV